MRSEQGWVAEVEERAAIETAVRGALVGRELVVVRYVEIAYGKPAWNAGRFHSIDYGVEFDLTDGATWAIIWQQEGWNETLLVFRETIRSQLRPGADVSTWDVSDTWHASFAGDVMSVETVWTKHRWGPSFSGPRFETQVDEGHASDYCLVTLLLRASSENCAVITLAGEANDRQGGTGADGSIGIEKESAATAAAY
jgi:hypothetical protein